MILSQIVGWGEYLPDKVLTNDNLSETIETSDEWIFPRTGIKQRHIALKKELTSDLAINAAKEAFVNSTISPSDIDCVIVATTTPDDTFPSTATKVQHFFKMKDTPAFDIQAVCSGFIYSLQVADTFIKCGNAKNILVIGAETLSKIVDWKDRRTCVLFGDGAGAVIVSASEESRGILATKIYSDGSWHDSLYSDGGPSFNQKVGKIRMNGQDIFKQAVNKLSEATSKALDECNLLIKDIDWFIPHQANQRIISSTAKKLGISEEKTISTVKFHANTSAASIPLALSSAIKNRKIKDNHLIAMCAIGGGLTWGSCILKF